MNINMLIHVIAFYRRQKYLWTIKVNLLYGYVCPVLILVNINASRLLPTYTEHIKQNKDIKGKIVAISKSNT